MGGLVVRLRVAPLDKDLKLVSDDVVEQARKSSSTGVGWGGSGRRVWEAGC